MRASAGRRATPSANSGRFEQLALALALVVQLLGQRVARRGLEGLARLAHRMRGQARQALRDLLRFEQQQLVVEGRPRSGPTAPPVSARSRSSSSAMPMARAGPTRRGMAQVQPRSGTMPSLGRKGR